MQIDCIEIFEMISCLVMSVKCGLFQTIVLTVLIHEARILLHN